MAKKHKYIYSQVTGTISDEKSGSAYAKNMINESSINVKRKGHKNLLELTDVDLNPLKINGIFNYSYVDENGTEKSYKIVHAGEKLFKCDNDFSSSEEIEIDENITLKDQKSQAVLLGSGLFIAGGGELLLYDGHMLKSARHAKQVYIPTTSCAIFNEEKGGGRTRGECPNILTPRRKNTLRGTSNYQEEKKANVFLLDSHISKMSRLLIEIKIRTRTSYGNGGYIYDEETDQFIDPFPRATRYIGINEAGEEVSAVVTLRYEIKQMLGTVNISPNGPLTDEEGNIVNIKIGDKVYEYTELPFWITIRNYRELYMPFEVLSPFDNEDNITVEFETQNELDLSKLSNASLLCLSNGENGKAILVSCFGDNKLYFTDKKNGIYHMPSENEISLGSDGEKITAIIRLSDNIIGVFKKNSFYRVRFTLSNGNGYEIFHSTDYVGAISQYSSAIVNNSCFVFNDSGVFDVDDNKLSSNVFSSLKQRSSNIDSYLKAHTREEREKAVAISLGKKYYLFLGDRAYIADLDYRTKAKATGEYSYEWWIWDFTPVSCVYTDGESIYFGTENGEIRTLASDYYDTNIFSYKTSDSSLLCREENGITTFILSGGYKQDGKMTRAILSPHERLLAKGVIYNATSLCLNDAFFYPDGTPKFYETMELSIYDQEGELVEASTVTEIDLLNKEIKVSAPLLPGEKYDLYLEVGKGEEYDVTGNLFIWWLVKNGEVIALKSFSDLELTLKQIEAIVGEYKTIPLCFDLPTTKKTLKGIYLKLPKNARGKIKIELETKRARQEKEIELGKCFDFKALDFDNLSFDSELDIIAYVPVFMRGFEYITLKIVSDDGEPFGIDTIYFEYTREEK